MIPFTKKIKALVLLTLLFSLSTLYGAPAQVTIKINLKVSFALPDHATVYLSGSTEELGKWQPDFIPLQKTGPKAYQIELSLPKGGVVIQFKFTLGKWEMVEKGPQGEEIPNHALALDQNRTATYQVDSWNNYQMLSGQLPTWTGRVEEFPPLYSDHFKNWRKVWVYLPPNYDKNTNQNYPVLYMHDGNNVFDSKRSFGGAEWEVDETAEALIGKKKLREIIVVALANTSRRMDEYTPIPDIWYGGGEADAYGELIVKQLKPLIDKRYRTLKGRDYTGVMGSSLGGLVSMYIAIKYPSVFSKIGVVSPSIWWSNQWILGAVSNHQFKYSFQIWVDMGTKEGTSDANRNGVPDSLDDARALRDILVQKGFVHGKTLAYHEESGAQHNEYYWAKRVWRPLSFFWGN